jgi:hypothetical protein
MRGGNEAVERLLADIESALRNMEPSTAARLGMSGLIPGHDAERICRSNARTVLLAEHLIAEYLADRDEPVVLMKGLEAAALYPMPSMRSFRDVDVLSWNPHRLWADLMSRGFAHRATRRSDIDHHHLPALKAPFGQIGVEVHERPNTPAWGPLDVDVLMATAEPSRTGFEGVLRPRDDIHALVLALHAWKSGFTRPRDIYDALLLAVRSDIPVERTAAMFGLERCWRWTIEFGRVIFLDSRGARPSIARMVLPRSDGIQDRRRVRLTTPFLVAGPLRVVRGHITEYRLGRQARRPSSPVSER